MVNFDIVFDRQNRKYSPGDVINLDIRVRVNSEQKYRSVYVRLRGYAHVQWKESRQVRRNGKSHTEYTTYTADESYFRHYRTLIGREGGPEMRLSAGRHVYHASFPLPQRLPQNHDNTNGHIRYEAKVHMDVPWGVDNKETKMFFLIPRVDLNEFPHLREPVRVENEKSFGCCCWESDPLRIYNVLPQRGFVPGETFQYRLELKNDSDVTINTATVKLVEKIVYHAERPTSKTRESGRTLWEHEFNNHNNALVAPLQNKIFSVDLKFNPAWNFHFFDGCRIITVEYYLKSEARVSGCYTNLSNYTTITMGTIHFGNYREPQTPLAPMLPNISIPLPNFPVPSAPSDFATAPLAEPISEQPLPSYHDTLKMPQTTQIGWPGSNQMETPPPTFTEVELIAKKEKQ